MATLLPKEQAAIDAARARGLSQGKIDKFLSENTGDYSRLKDQQPDSVTGAVGAAPSIGGDGASSSTPLSALQTVAPPTPGAPNPEAQGGSNLGGGGEVSLPGAGALRASLGKRIYPQAVSALAGLKKAY